ncbi:hypothetical protein PMAYCL1PPCAC_20431, partial [Pristionchus mayeri]
RNESGHSRGRLRYATATTHSDAAEAARRVREQADDPAPGGDTRFSGRHYRSPGCELSRRAAGAGDGLPRGETRSQDSLLSGRRRSHWALQDHSPYLESRFWTVLISSSSSTMASSAISRSLPSSSCTKV